MNARTVVALAVSRIWATKSRSFLTMLGVIIGVASLVALTSIASGATSSITSSLGSLGATTITVQSTADTALTEADAAAVAALPNVQRVAETASGSGTATFGSTTATISLTGVSPGYAAATQPAIAVGRYLTTFDGSERTRTVVLSATAANELGITGGDIGSTVTLDGLPFTLVGVLDDANGFGASGSASVSMASARLLFAQAPYVSSITVIADESEHVASVQSATDALLRDRYGLGAGDTARFSTTNLSSLLSSIDTIRGLLSLLLGGIASISLVVGGIGIMNIMLVSVRERTREIGVRRAIGAKRRQILAQFLVEAVVLSVLGGIIGLGVGIGLSALIAGVAGWAFAVSATTIGVALGFSLVVGVVFGVWPARSASRLQPVDALRFE
ncbi:ABC transporter permease [uncultured Amnibacterium sp.]|uniref:ABC transporter permease n=1 Tax=uncultured Amnibacterium sp. TaxID=1631851 RepID=UPI0035CCA3E5